MAKKDSYCCVCADWFLLSISSAALTIWWWDSGSAGRPNQARLQDSDMCSEPPLPDFCPNSFQLFFLSSFGGNAAGGTFAISYIVNFDPALPHECTPFGIEQVDLPVTDRLPFNIFVLATTWGPKTNRNVGRFTLSLKAASHGHKVSQHFDHRLRAGGHLGRFDLSTELIMIVKLRLSAKPRKRTKDIMESQNSFLTSCAQDHKWDDSEMIVMMWINDDKIWRQAATQTSPGLRNCWQYHNMVRKPGFSFAPFCKASMRFLWRWNWKAATFQGSF